MHNALFIDEILRHIFTFAPHDLVSLASTCKNFWDPAIDLRWRHISSLIGLLLLIPGVNIKDDTLSVAFTVDSELDLKKFHNYARRVKILSHGAILKCDDVLYQLLQSARPSTSGFLPNLSSVSFAKGTCTPITALFSFSDCLRTVDFDCGFSSRRIDLKSTESWFCDLANSSPTLSNLNIRGAVSVPLTKSIYMASAVETLTLHVGSCLRLETLAAVVTFPHLQKLDLHAGNLSAQELENTLAVANGTPILPKVHSIQLRGRSDLVHYIISKTSHLSSLRIELEDDDIIPVQTWKSLIFLIGTRCPMLEDLTIDHHIETHEEHPTDAPPQNPNIISRPPTPTLGQTKSELNFSLFHSLRSLRSLRTFSIDTTMPFLANDDDIASLIRWWPTLEHLDLGASVIHAQATQVSLKSLVTLTNGLGNLQSLILPINMQLEDDEEEEDGSSAYPPIVSSSLLRRLTLACLSPPNVEYLIPLLSRYPFLTSVDGLPDHDVEWEAISQVLTSQRTHFHGHPQSSVGHSL